MEIIGRVTANAQVTETKSGKQAVNFTIAVNESYKPRNGERKQLTNYFKCSYWLNSAVAQYLKKGLVVHATGRIGVDAFIGRDGKAKGQLTLRADTIAWFSASGQAKSNEAEVVAGPVEDLPF